ncbi:TetR/AcrR family transcriptional regulator [Pseudonocardiaceae bacterium YIM PH 21723]|nr:TetR/AcrR family transcriptional regulator [Pseudonocardiaceae bacterium YIM PH 21723]
MPPKTSARTLSTAEERRATVLRTAIHAFAARGYYGTTTTEVAKEAGISQPYLYRLFPDKEALFVAVIEHCSLRMRECFADAAATASGSDPASALDALGDAYARLITDRDLLLVMMQANCAASEPAIREAVQGGYARLVEYVRAVSGADDAQIQQFFATGFLCNTVVAMGADTVDAPWARTLGRGLRHY